ncbi:TRAP transporter small permease [Marinobacter sp. SS21]|uniref:TRAP transporter small permease n=1 Tax=Marinobacter sp. SS21 TaxID=2979460 RepID=UPI00232AD931|nr:TRAP transporter small permease subunit [Marinobacter sp. SS21]MDC0662975.1 TRAP transporter small permease subunit [Marinobacter sp. SS21]
MATIEAYHGIRGEAGSWRVLGCARGFLARVETWLLNLAVLCILGLGCIITASVVLRWVATSGVSDEVVIVGELMIGALILPLAFVAADRGFIAVEVLTNRFGPRAQHWLNVLAALVGLVAVAPIAYAAGLSMVDAIKSGAYFFGLLELPKWPGLVLFFVGYAAFFIRLIDLAVYEVLASLGVINVPPHQPGLMEE